MFCMFLRSYLLVLLSNLSSFSNLFVYPFCVNFIIFVSPLQFDVYYLCCHSYINVTHCNLISYMKERNPQKQYAKPDCYMKNAAVTSAAHHTKPIDETIQHAHVKPSKQCFFIDFKIRHTALSIWIVLLQNVNRKIKLMTRNIKYNCYFLAKVTT